MKKYKLIATTIWGDALTGEYDNVVKGIAEAQKRADELLDEYLHNYPDCVVNCFEEWNYPGRYEDYLVWQKDIFGERYWKIMRVNNGCPMVLELLSDYEQYLIEEEVEREVSDLSDDELAGLYKEITIDSLYISDYENSYSVDETKLSNVCDGYMEHLEGVDDGERKDDTIENFINYIRSH